MFTQNTPHTGNGIQRTARNSIIIKVGAMSATAALGTALALAAPLSASADTRPTATAQGRFLSGSVAGINLDDLAAVGAASVHNNGAQSLQVSRDPLTVSALRSTLINQPGGVQLNLGNIIDLGALNQYAQAANNGTSMASSGAINNDGGIGVGKIGTATNGSATVDLDGLLNSRFASIISDVRLQAIAVAAQANANMKTASGRYSLAGLKLNFTSPAIGGLTNKVSSALAPVTVQLDALGGTNGDLAHSLNGSLTSINPLLNVLGAHASVNAKVTANLNAALKPLLTGTYGNNGVSINLNTGAVSVDLATLLGGNINNEPVGTQVLSDKVVNEILNGITGTVSTLADQIVAKVKNVLDNAQVDVDATVDVSTAQAPIVNKVCTAVPGSGSGSGSSGGVGGLVGGLLGGTVGGVTGTVGGLLCHTTTKLLPNLNTSLDLHVHGTVAQIINGNAAAANATVKVLGVPVSINLDRILSGLGGVLSDHLLDGTSAISGLTSSLNTKLVNPAVTGLLGSGNTVGTALAGALSVTLNNQDKSSGGTFTETALRVQALPGLSSTGGLATINLAAATVGPNVTTVVVPGSPSDPGNPTTPGNPSNPGNPTSPGSPSNPGNPNSPITPTSFGSLAFTGVGIATLVGVILALLAAGAYLVREGYRRNGRRQIS